MSALMKVDLLENQPKPSAWQKAKVWAKSKFDSVAMPVAVVGAGAVMSANANAAETFTLDVSGVMSAITLVVAAVTSIGLAALSITITIKAIGYVKKSF